MCLCLTTSLMVATKPVDFREGTEGLAALVREATLSILLRDNGHAKLGDKTLHEFNSDMRSGSLQRTVVRSSMARWATGSAASPATSRRVTMLDGLD